MIRLARFVVASPAFPLFASLLVGLPSAVLLDRLI